MNIDMYSLIDTILRGEEPSNELIKSTVIMRNKKLDVLRNYLSKGIPVPNISIGYDNKYPCLVWSPELNIGAVVNNSVDSNEFKYELYTFEQPDCGSNILLGFIFMIYSNDITYEHARELLSTQLPLGMAFSFTKKRHYIECI